VLQTVTSTQPQAGRDHPRQFFDRRSSRRACSARLRGRELGPCYKSGDEEGGGDRDLLACGLWAAFALAYSPARVRVITVRAHAHVDRAALAALRAATDAARLSDRLGDAGWRR
jgi:hypothetical protein